jgi:glycosyltransferase involved in cell wall biosynthesis
MRICLVGPAYPYRGGISHFTQMLAATMTAEGHEPHIVSFTRLYPSFLFPGRTQYEEQGARVRIEGERVIDSINPVTWKRAGEAVARFSPDAIIVQWWHPFFAPAFRGVIASARRGRVSSSVVYLCHNVLPHEENRADRALVRWGLAKADAFLVQSQEDRAKLLSLRAGARVAVHPHPTYTQFAEGNITRQDARQKLAVEGRVLLFFGLIRPYKGLHTLLQAYARVAEKLDATLLIVGEFYEKRAPYDAEIAKLGIGARVRVVNRYIPDEEVEVYFRAADLVVLPYRSATQSGITQTAFAFERPVVVTAVGGLPDVVDDGVTGYVVPPDNPEALAGAIERFFATGAAGAMATAIRAQSDRFSWKGCVAALLALTGPPS